MANRYADRPYAVGKGKPPVHTQFGKGQPTGRGGRRKGSRNADTILREALDASITVIENGKERQISKFMAGVLQIVNKAAQGDLKAFTVMMELKRDLDARVDPALTEPLRDADRKILEDLARRMASHGGDTQ